MGAGQNGQLGLLVRNLARNAKKALMDQEISLEKPAKDHVPIHLRHMEETTAKALRMTWIYATYPYHAVIFYQVANKLTQLLSNQKTV